MANETLMTDQAATTPEGTPSSQTPAPAQQTAATEPGTTQQAPAETSTAPQEGKPADQNQGDNKAPEAPKVPETYEFKAADGRAYDTEIVKVYSEVAKELSLTQESAQKMLDRLAPALEARQTQLLEVTRNGWAESSKADKEFGGEKLSENLAIAKGPLDKFGSPEFRELLEATGLGNHPELIRFLYRAGKAIGGDRFVGNSAGAGSRQIPKDFAGLADAMYPTSNQQQ